MRTAILHIGTAKTGSTSIQRFIARNSDVLAAAGFGCLDSLGLPSARILASYALDPKRKDELFNSLKLFNEPARDRFRAEVEGRLEAEIAALDDSVHTVLVSSEHLYSRLISVAEVTRVRSLLAKYFDNFKVIAYLRRQDKAAISMYSTLLKVGGVAEKPLSNPNAARYDYDDFLDRWASVFGESAIVPRVFDRADFVNGDLLADFAHTCGLGDMAAFETVGVLNESLRPAAQAFVLHINRQIKTRAADDKALGKEIRKLMRHVGDDHKGAGRLPARREVEDFMAPFAESNERVRQRWFPGRSTLFDDDFSMYGEKPTPPAALPEIMGVAFDILRRCAADLVEARGDGILAKARLQIQKGAPKRAERLLNEAIASNGANIEARLELARLYAEQGATERAKAQLARIGELAPEGKAVLRMVRKIEKRLLAAGSAEGERPDRDKAGRKRGKARAALAATPG